MNYSLNLPEAVRTKVARAFIKHLKSDPVLSREVRLWEEYAERTEDFEVVPIEKTPAIRFTVSAQSSNPDSFTSYTANLSINMEIIVAGNNQFDMINLWEAIESAIHPFFDGDKAMKEALKGDKRAIYATHFIQNSSINHQKYANPPCMVGNGSVSIVLSIRRP